ncbi:MAG: DNA polymerase III subunit delta [Planctomycetota bacterium]|nr:MAG: DNA polymerase III subunit delta [Planctomycetota bacterium]
MSAKRQAQESKSVPVYVVHGAEAFLKRQAITEIIDRLLGDADRSMAVSEYDGSAASLELATVLDDLRTLPFMSNYRLVIVYDADSFITRYRQDLEEYIENPSSTGVLVAECRSFPGTTRLAKRVRAAGEIVKCEQLAARSVPSWLVDRCGSVYGIKLDPPAASMLCELIGDDLGLLDAELHKLSLYVGGRGRITVSDVKSLTDHYREEKVWGILSAIAAGDQSLALQLWEEVWQTDRAASARAISGIAFSVRKLLNAKRAQESGASLYELSRMLWCDERQARAEISAFSADQLEAMLCRLLEADVAAKTSLASVRSSVEAFIIEMCSKGQTRRATG